MPRIVLATCSCLLAVVLVAAAPACWAAEPEAETSKTDSLPEVTELEGDPVFTVLPPDGIPAIDSPSFASAGDASFMDDEEPVVGVVHRGVAKAYSLWHLDRHEVVNDLFADEPLAVTW